MSPEDRAFLEQLKATLEARYVVAPIDEMTKALLILITQALQ